MPIDFPNSPALNDTFSVGGRTWKYDGATWRQLPKFTSPKAIEIGSTAPSDTEILWLDTSTTGTAGIPGPAPFRNAIMNGDFQINQRAITTTNTNSSYLFDRWALINNSGTITYSSEPVTLGSEPAAGYIAPRFARSTTPAGQNATTTLTQLRQDIEDVRTFAGRTVTVSLWAKGQNNGDKIAIELIQNMGTGGSPSSPTTNFVSSHTLTTNWVRYSGTVALPSLTGKTLGTTANTSSLRLNIWVSAGTDYAARTNSMGVQATTIDFWGVQVEEGTAPSEFEQRPFDVELARCQRYFWTIPAPTSAYQKIGTGYVSTSNLVQAISIQYPVTMRTTPVMTVPISGNNVTIYDGAEPNMASIADGSPWYTTQHVTFNASASASTLTVGRTAHVIHRGGTWTFSADY